MSALSYGRRDQRPYNKADIGPKVNIFKITAATIWSQPVYIKKFLAMNYRVTAKLTHN